MILKPMLLGVIFDVDGVLVASPHEEAWRQAIRALLENEWKAVAKVPWTSFTTEFYQSHVAGRPRLEGSAAILREFMIADQDGVRSALLSERKQAILAGMLERGCFHEFPDAVRFLLAVKKHGILVAAASSSKNAPTLLARIRVPENGRALADMLDASVCGRDFRYGKPDPEIFLTAAQELGLSPETCAVVEDAPAGILAAKNATMLAIGVARHGDEHLLREAGADWVVRSLDEIDLDRLVRCGSQE